VLCLSLANAQAAESMVPHSCADRERGLTMKFTPVFVLFALALLGAPLHAEIAQDLCVQCLATAKEELKKCLDAAISQEDKTSCAQKKETRAKACDDGECKIARAAQNGNKSEGLQNKTPISIP
jgi:hypothetical protein